MDEKEKKDNLEEETLENQEQGTEESKEKGDKDEQKDSNLPKTQAELDKIIKKAMRKAEKQAQKTGAPAKQSVAGGAGEKELPQDGQESQNTQLAADYQNKQRELLIASATIEAMKAGILPNVVDDAVILALREAEKDGEADAEDIGDALEEVLKRHPEWKNQKEQQKGFTVGADGKDKEDEKGNKPAMTGAVFF